MDETFRIPELTSALQEAARIEDAEERDFRISDIVANLIAVDPDLARSIMTEISNPGDRFWRWLNLTLVTRQRSDLYEAERAMREAVNENVELSGDFSPALSVVASLLKRDIAEASRAAEIIRDTMIRYSCYSWIIVEGKTRLDLIQPILSKLIKKSEEGTPIDIMDGMEASLAELIVESSLGLSDRKKRRREQLMSVIECGAPKPIIRTFALEAISAGNVELGMDVLQKYLKENTPFDEEVHFSLAKGRLHEGDLVGARELLSRLTDPQNRCAIYAGLATALLRRN